MKLFSASRWTSVLKFYIRDLKGWVPCFAGSLKLSASQGSSKPRTKEKWRKRGKAQEPLIIREGQSAAEFVRKRPIRADRVRMGFFI